MPHLIVSGFVHVGLSVRGVVLCADNLPVLVVFVLDVGIALGVVDLRLPVQAVVGFGNQLPGFVVPPGRRVSVCAEHQLPVRVIVFGICFNPGFFVDMLHPGVSQFLHHNGLVMLVHVDFLDLVPPQVILRPFSAVSVRVGPADAVPGIVVFLFRPAVDGLHGAPAQAVPVIPERPVRVVIHFRDGFSVIGIQDIRVSLRPGRRLAVRPVIVGGLDLPALVGGHHFGELVLGVVEQVPVFPGIGNPDLLVAEILVFNLRVTVRSRRQVVLRIVPGVALHQVVRVILRNPVAPHRIPVLVVVPGALVFPSPVGAYLPGISVRPVDRLPVLPEVGGFRHLPGAVLRGLAGIPVNAVDGRAAGIQEVFPAYPVPGGVAVFDRGVSLVGRNHRISGVVYKGLRGHQPVIVPDHHHFRPQVRGQFRVCQHRYRQQQHQNQHQFLHNGLLVEVVVL